MNAKPAKKDVSDKVWKIVFSVLLIASAVGLFLLSENGRALLSGGAPDATDAGEGVGVVKNATHTARLPELSPFMEQAESRGIAWGSKPTSESAEVVEYALMRDGAKEARASLSLKDSRVVAFVLACTVADAPVPPLEGAPNIDVYIYEFLQEEHEKDRLWRKQAFIALAATLDTQDAVTNAALETLFRLSDDVIADGKSRSDSVNGFTFNAFMETEKGEGVLKLVFSAELEEK